MTPRKMPDRPLDMSQLDYLWLNFGGFHVENEASAIPQEDVILTEQALTDLIQKSTSGGITTLTYKKHPTKDGVMQLVGTSLNGSELTVVEMPEEVHVSSFSHRKVTQTDIDNGVTFPIDSEVLSIVLTNGKEFLVSLEELNLIIRGGETDTINTKVTNGVVNSHLKIDSGNNTLSVVEIKSSEAGIYANLKISQTNKGVEIFKADDGLQGAIPIGNTGIHIKFDKLTLSQYQLLEKKDPGTLYFITDKPYIYLGDMRYGVDIFPWEAPIVSIVYDADHMLLSYKKADGSDIQQIHMGPANEDTPGMMSTETYIELQKLKAALDDITNVKDYVEQEVSKAAFSIELGEEANDQIPLNLKNKNREILSTVQLDKEDHLVSGLVRSAEEGDVSDNVTLGDKLLILTLKSGKSVIVNVQSLIDIYEGENSKSISMQIADNKISANLNISAQDKMLFIYDDGVSSHFKVVRQPSKLIFYGKTQTDADKLGEVDLPDSLIKYDFISAASEDTITKYPPSHIDGKDYNEQTNPVKIGQPYFILVFGLDTGEAITSYQYCDYISIFPILNSIVLSPKEGNILTRDEDGYLYGSINWIDVQ